MKKDLEEILKYDTFNYNSFSVNYSEDTITLSFDYEIVGLEKFNHVLELPYTSSNINKEYVEKLAFNIGMLELVNYWKSTISKNVNIKCGMLDEEQIKFFKKVYFYGLGEFFYRNDITNDIDSFMNINCSGKVYNTNIDYSGVGNLICIGGGKDSCVSLELLKNEKDNSCFMINPRTVHLDCCKAAGIDSIFGVKRVIDKNLIKLNDEGYLNGHVPFSAMISFVSFLVAYLNNKKNIILSNESSANQVNVLGTKINHQYSKSYEYELDFQNYSKKYLCKDINYFSLLRPLSEYQIGMLFSKKCSNYFKVFKSCNLGSKENPWIWCCKCPKCLFVFSLLSPYLYKDKLLDIFGTDMFDDSNNLQTFKELLGKENVKPFDCVGTFEEINYAITKTIKNYSSELPYLLKYYKDNYYDEDILNMDLEHSYNHEHSLDEYYENIIKEVIL